MLLRTFDELRAATNDRGKKENHDYRIDSYHFILTSRRGGGGVNPTVALQPAIEAQDGEINSITKIKFVVSRMIPSRVLNAVGQ